MKQDYMDEASRRTCALKVVNEYCIVASIHWFKTKKIEDIKKMRESEIQIRDKGFFIVDDKPTTPIPHWFGVNHIIVIEE